MRIAYSELIFGHLTLSYHMKKIFFRKRRQTEAMNNILVTGGVGFIGSHLCERLLRERHHVE